MLQDNTVVGCIDAEKLWKHFRDLHKRYRPEPGTSNQANLYLPNFIPLIAESKMDLTAVASDRLLGISLGDILTDSGKVAFSTAAQLRRRLRTSPTSRIALVGTGMDQKLERFWKRSDLDESWRRIVDLEFEFVTGCTFSVWYEDPRFDQIYNRERNMFSHAMFSSLGVPSIPFMLFSRNDRDYRENMEWLRHRDNTNFVAMLGQTGRSKSEFSELIDEMNSITNEVKRPIRFIVVGPSEPSRIASVMGNFRATILTSRPFQAALHGEQADSALEFEENREASREYLFNWNIEQFETYCYRHCRCPEEERAVTRPHEFKIIDSQNRPKAIKATPARQGYYRRTLK